jgi:zinc/manganese transport system substrate-binding protein
VGASESIFEPLARGLGLRLITPPGYLKATSEGTEPTAQDKQDVDHQLSTRQVRVWIDNEQNATPDTQRMTETARKAHIPVVTMTETPPEGASFQDWQTAQLSQLSAALNHGASP